jgi:glycerol-3-phosphate O-acyltransferase
MFGTVEIPVWLLWVAGLLAAIAALDRIIGPGIRWFLRRRMERALARVNARLERKIEPFKLARRQDMIVRLLYDARVLEAVSDHAAETRVPGSVAFEEARRYAREIVPGFSATLYFGFATRAAKAFSRMLYRVRVGKVDAALAHIDPKATVIFVINHRSNMDYVLITWLVADRSAISYAVGEWARIWPLSAMIRAMGAYFIRRGRNNALYRKILARYVQIATEDGTTQAIFPEGGLSLDGRVGPPKMGLLSYIVEGFEPEGRDVVFVPVGLGYDRVLEDRVLIAAAVEGGRKFRNRPLRVVGYALRMLWNRFRGRFKGFGTAAAGFGAPVSLRAFLATGGTVDALGAKLMTAIASVVPVLPVPLVAAALGDGATSRDELRSRVEVLTARLVASGAVLKLPPQGIEATLNEGLLPLIARGVVGNDLQPVGAERAVLQFYAASVPMSALHAATPQT